MSEVPLYSEAFPTASQLAANSRDTARHRGSSLIRNTPPVGPYGSPMTWGPMVILGGWVLFMSEVPLYPRRAILGPDCVSGSPALPSDAALDSG